MSILDNRVLPDALTEEQWTYLARILNISMATLAQMTNRELLRAVDARNAALTNAGALTRRALIAKYGGSANDLTRCESASATSSSSRPPDATLDAGAPLLALVSRRNGGSSST